jgi:hypothetical protein
MQEVLTAALICLLLTVATIVWQSEWFWVLAGRVTGAL